MSESRVVSVVNVVPQDGVTACTIVVFSNIKTPENKAEIKIADL